MPNSASGRSLHEQRLDALIAEYLQAEEQGRPLDQQDFLKQHAEFSAELQEFFADVGRIEQVAQPVTPKGTQTPEIRNYRLIEKLGEGGMGTVYRAVHVRLEKTVALKIMKADRSGNPQAVSRFEREMKAIGRLEHPHIVRALDAGEEQGVYFLVMEYVAGIDLDQFVRSQGPLPVAETCEIVRQAALGLAHAHEHNLVHRDVKPSNLMLSPEGQVKVLDLGLAQFQLLSTGGLELTLDGQMIGTLLYMSPEQRAGGKNVDHRSDVFSLGVTLYCLLAGGLPLERGQDAAMLPEIGQVRSDIPSELAALLPQLLAASPEDRLGSMAQLAERLKPLAAERPLTALVAKTRNLTATRAALPPAILPSRTPQVQTPAAQVSTISAHHDLTLVTSGSKVLSSTRSLATSPITGWIAAGLATTALAVVLALFWPEPKTSIIVPGQTQQLPIDVPPAPPPPPPPLPPAMSMYATIPDTSGPLVRYTGYLWYADLPTDKDTFFELVLRSKDKEVVGDVEHRWIEIETRTSTATGDYLEKGLLLVDPQRYEREKELLVKQGWVSAESESLKGRLAYQFPQDKSNELLDRLVVEFQRTDRLAQRADELGLELPPIRLSIQDALVLLFGAHIPDAPEALVSARVMPGNDGRRIVGQELVDSTLCHVIRSHSIDQIFTAPRGYLFATSPNVPFGLHTLQVNSSTLRVSCRYMHSDGSTVNAPPDKADITRRAEFFASMKKPELDPIGNALLPKAVGARTKYTGTLERGGLPEIAFDVEIRAAGTERDGETQLHVLEIRAETITKDAPRHVEEARVRVLPYRPDQANLEIHDGWMRTLGQTFAFDRDGSLSEVDDGLLMLGHKLPLNRLSVHDVLALLFGTHLNEPASRKIGELRGAVQRMLIDHPERRKFSETEVPIRGRPSVPGDLWVFDSPGLKYKIVRSHDVPFDFCTVNFESVLQPGFKIVCGMTGFDPADSATLLDGAVLQSEAEKTKASIATLGGNQNKRIWRTPTVSLFAEFAGTAVVDDGPRKRTKVFLAPHKTRPNEEVKFLYLYLDELLRKEDRDWVEAGRCWDDGKRCQFDKSFMIGGIRKVRRKGNEDLPFSQFSAGDQKWINDQEGLRSAESQLNGRK